jgi:hypothetical protein
MKFRLGVAEWEVSSWIKRGSGMKEKGMVSGSARGWIKRGSGMRGKVASPPYPGFSKLGPIDRFDQLTEP